MLGFIEWVEIDRKKKEKARKNERSNSQASEPNGHVHQQGKTVGDDPQKPSETVHLFPIPEQR